jgi:MerR family transcriptional regulator, light-induced transcriptional regulator
MLNLHDMFLDALRKGDRRAAFRTIDEAIIAGGAAGEIYMDVIQPSLRRIGDLWQHNALTVAEEHLATSIAQDAMSRIYQRAHIALEEERAPKLIAACADEEQHQVGLRMLCDLLEMDGWDTLYLGASVPIDSLVRLVEMQLPDAVALSASIAPHILRVREAIDTIRSANLPKQPVIAVGGNAFLLDPSLAAQIGADITASDAVEAVQILNESIRSQLAS